jgi:hypothetical protein
MKHAMALIKVVASVSVDVGNSLGAVACPSESVCVAIDSTGYEVTFDPASPSGATSAPIDSGVELSGVACWLTSACSAIGNNGDEIDFDPGAPGSATRAAIGSAGHVSCVVPATTPQQCTVVDGGDEMTFNPASPGSPPSTTIDGANFLSAVACPSVSQCTAVDQIGQAVTFNPGSPAPTTTTIDSGENSELSALACPSVSQCTAVDSAGRATTFDPQAPTSPAPTVTQIDTTPDNELEGIACPSASACVAEDVGGNVIEGDPLSGVPWTAIPIAPSILLTGIACGSSTVCIAVDASGDVYVGTPASNPAPPNAAPVFTADTPPGLSAAKFYGIGSVINDAASSPAYRFAASGFPAPTYAVSSGALPTGMALNPSTGFLTGTPTVSGQAYTFTVTASNGVAPAAVSASITGTVGAQGACATVVPGSPNEFTSVGTIAVTNTVHGVSASVAQIVGDPVNQPRFTLTTNFGPGTVHTGPNEDCTFTLAAGQEDTNIEVDYAQTIIEESPATPTATTVSGSPASSSLGQPVTYSASVAPSSPNATNPSGTVAFTTTTGPATTDLCTATLSSGSGSCTSAAAPSGTDTITATYSGDNTFAGSSGTATETVTSSAGPVPVGTTPAPAGSTVSAPGPVGSAAPIVKGCPAATGKVTGTALGLLKLGETRARARKAYAKTTYRRTKYQDFFCLTPIGIRVGYGSPALLKSVPAHQRKRLSGRAVWASTTNSFYAIHGIRVGTLLSKARKALKLTGPVRVRHNTWYLARNGASTAVFKARGRTITEIGIATKTLSTGHKQRVALLKSFI